MTGETAFRFTGDFLTIVDTTVLLVLFGGDAILFCLDFLLAGEQAGAEASGEGEAGASVGEDRGGVEQSVARDGDIVDAWVREMAGGLSGQDVGDGGQDDALVKGGDFSRQLPRAFGLPLFLFCPRGTALSWDVTSKSPSLYDMPTVCLQSFPC